MYAIIRTGGKQAKVQPGDVLDVERLRADGDEVTFSPLLIVDDDGTVHSGRDELAEARVVASVLGGSLGPKVDIFKYRAKTGYRRRQGHRQKYTQIRVEAIELKPPKKKPAAKKPAADKAVKSEPAAEVEAADEPVETAEATATAEPAARAATTKAKSTEKSSAPAKEA